ncbi:DUF2269 family protein [Sutcliffiella cohnii]|uniref:DUF2269 domain-containing protein n=1 Tax=Sutcliffiella cohnii TaxID=33932 RepID=A0A223KPN9_9BACI|nr:MULTISPECIES: DUF2269 family protein [Sutcliffiella]AST91470.1 hypothetical protein BC6307_09345 [Sutcliffiella cohnii]MED4014966.1 DUF2269 family protein [Sutcliffiella cohnii]WBL17301.1 DUF2269 family protein [Sutcliffiella sp. NC1]
MVWLVLFHVLTSIVGFGPTFFSFILLRKSQTISDLRHNLILHHKLHYFPKIGGTLAVISGILLVLLGDYGTILQVWLFGSIILFMAIQVLYIGFILPALFELQEWVLHPNNRASTQLPLEQLMLLRKACNYYYVVIILTLLIFTFMILKPN